VGRAALVTGIAGEQGSYLMMATGTRQSALTLLLRISTQPNAGGY